MVTLAVERHRVEDPGERQHVAASDCWCGPVVEVVHRRQEAECIAVYQGLVCGLAERHHHADGPRARRFGVAGHPFIAPRPSVQALREAGAL